MLIGLLLIVAAYLLGSISSAVLVSRAMKLPDPRSIGSGNPGATNVLRTGNKTAAILTLVGDLLKGFIPTLACYAITGDHWLTAVVGVAAFLGHLYPVFLKFKGGKGVATALGVILGMNVPIALLLVVTWFLVAYFKKYSSLAAITTALLAPIYFAALYTVHAYVAATIVIAGFIFLRHTDNIRRLMRDEETKISFHRKSGS